MSDRERSALIARVRNPLAFFTLALIVLEAVLGLVVGVGLPEDKRWPGFLIMVGLIVFVVLVVAVITYLRPGNLYEPTKDRLYLPGQGKNVEIEMDEPAD